MWLHFNFEKSPLKFVFLFCFFEMGSWNSLCSRLGWPRTHRDQSASASQMLKSKLYATTISLHEFTFKNKQFNVFGTKTLSHISLEYNFCVCLQWAFNIFDKMKLPWESMRMPSSGNDIWFWTRCQSISQTNRILPLTLCLLCQHSICTDMNFKSPDQNNQRYLIKTLRKSIPG